MWVLIFVLFLVAIIYYYQETKRPANYPPGPKWYPFIGNQRTFRNVVKKVGGPHLAFTQLAKDYNTNVLGLKLGGDLTIVVSGYKTLHAVLTNNDYDARPDGYFIRLRCMGERRGVTCIDGPFWVEQRRFIMRHLRNIGYGKKPMEIIMREEVESMILQFEEKQNNIQLEPVLAYAVLNVLWSFVTGNRIIDKTDSRLEKFIGLLHRRSKAFDMAGGTLNQMPWLRYFIPEKIGYNLVMEINTELKSFFTESITEHMSSWYPDRDDDLIYSFITEMKQNAEYGHLYTVDQLVVICLDLFFAGSTTTSHTLDFIFLCLILHPQVQEKAAKIIIDKLGTDEPFSYTDRTKLPYIEAIVTEVERVYGVTPVTGPRRVLNETELEGYTIPKETTVLINNYSIRMDKDYWGDPEVFRPERFIDKNGKLLPDDHVLNFGLGRRRCLGELLARQCIFIFLCSIVRKFKICPVSETEKPSPIPNSGMTLAAKDYFVKLIPRC